MKTHDDLYKEIYAYNNLYSAYKKARKHKTKKKYVTDFEYNLHQNLKELRFQLINQSYKPKPLETFIVRDPKTRKISKSHFKDRIIHHVLYSVLEPIYEKIFIYDSFANRKGKGTLGAIKRFDYFKRKCSKNNSKTVYILKCDIKKYFETVDKEILIKIINRTIKDEKVILLIKKILNNYETKDKKGMPLGNLTSQFFANIYLNELDYFIKHKLKVKYYIRYVDDFLILHENKGNLEYFKVEIEKFLKNNLKLELHQGKSKINKLDKGADFLGYRIFYHYKLLRRRNLRNFKRKLNLYIKQYNNNKIDYDYIYIRFESFVAYSKHANTYILMSKLIQDFQSNFKTEMSNLEINRYLKYKNKLINR